jgi:hypothetical protein
MPSYVEKFSEYINKNRVDIFQYKTPHEIIMEESIDSNIIRHFYKFVGQSRMPIEIFESINTRKFIKLALCYYYSSLED